jgi:hypothetical protein
MDFLRLIDLRRIIHKNSRISILKLPEQFRLRAVDGLDELFTGVSSERTLSSTSGSSVHRISHRILWKQKEGAKRKSTAEVAVDCS